MDGSKLAVAIAVRDAIYPLDFLEHHFALAESEQSDFVTEYIVTALREYSENHIEKFIGAGISAQLAERNPRLSSRLWLELDIMPLVVPGDKTLSSGYHENVHWGARKQDEQAEYLAMKCVRYVQLEAKKEPLQ